MKTKLYISALVTIVIIFLFLFSPDILLYALLEDPYVPFGTILTWIGIISLTSLFYFWFRLLSKSKSNFTGFFLNGFTVLRTLSILWILIAYFLANNWSSTFSNQITGFRGSVEAGIYYWWVNYFILGAPIILFLTFIILRIFKKA